MKAAPRGYRQLIFCLAAVAVVVAGLYTREDVKRWSGLGRAKLSLEVSHPHDFERTVFEVTLTPGDIATSPGMLGRYVDGQEENPRLGLTVFDGNDRPTLWSVENPTRVGQLRWRFAASELTHARTYFEEESRLGFAAKAKKAKPRRYQAEFVLVDSQANRFGRGGRFLKLVSQEVRIP